MSGEGRHEDERVDAVEPDADDIAHTAASDPEMLVEPHVPTEPDPHLEHERRFSEDAVERAILRLSDEDDTSTVDD